MAQCNPKVVTDAIRVLQQAGESADKITLHKFLYFAEVMGFQTGLKFEPYTYGPFSFQLAEKLQFMEIFGQVGQGGDGYYLKGPDETGGLDAALQDIFEKFKQAVGDFSFRSLECVGTLLYCYVALKKVGHQTGDRDIIDEFKSWKGPKYSDDELSAYLGRLHSAGVFA